MSIHSEGYWEQSISESLCDCSDGPCGWVHYVRDGKPKWVLKCKIENKKHPALTEFLLDLGAGLLKAGQDPTHRLGVVIHPVPINKELQNET